MWPIHLGSGEARSRPSQRGVSDEGLSPEKIVFSSSQEEYDAAGVEKDRPFFRCNLLRRVRGFARSMLKICKEYRAGSISHFNMFSLPCFMI